MASTDAAPERRSKSVNKSGLRRDVLKEISASLNHSEDSDNSYNEQNQAYPETSYSQDSLDEISPPSERTTDSDKLRRSSEVPVKSNRRQHSESSGQRRSSESSDRRLGRRGSDYQKSRPQFRSETDLRAVGNASERSRKRSVKKSQSQAELSSSRQKEEKREKKPAGKRTSRYMEWYTKSKPNGDKEERRTSDASKQDVEVEKGTKSAVESRLFKETVSSSNKKVESAKKPNMGPEHPLLQHSEHRFEMQYPKKRAEEDADSGIVLTKPEMALKKSIFTIAYNDMHTSQLRPDSSVNTP
uniref:Uncharacterized protein n=2 Tax=Dendroctonus ponderosae TaxID=77166 RepID=A0AAR5NZ28_DENPD